MAACSPLLDILADVPDPRRAEGKLYKLPHVMLFAILAIVTGCNSYRGIVTFIGMHHHRLNAAFGLTWRRGPAHTAIRYILQGLDPLAVKAVFRRRAALLQAARTTPGQGSMARDGKTLRGSFEKLNVRAAAQVLSAFATDTALVLAHVNIAKKSNEIPAAQALLANLGVTRATIVTLDAVHSQKNTSRSRPRADITLIVQIKDNQSTLHQHSENIAATTAPLSAICIHNKSRNRDERRTVTVFYPAKHLADTGWQNHVAAIIRVEREVYTRDTVTGLLDHTSETAFYATKAPLTATRAADAIRAHWGIENTSHYSRHVTFGEDRSSIRINPGVFARLCRFAFNIPKANKTASISQDRYRAALAGVDHLLEMARTARALNSPGDRLVSCWP